MAQIHAIKMTYLKITTAAIFLFLLSCSTAQKTSINNYSRIAYKMTDRINTDGKIYVLRNQVEQGVPTTTPTIIYGENTCN